MKIIVIGKHASGKYEILNRCEELGVKVGREFCNATNTDKLYIDTKYEKYSNEDINNIFETNSYICLSGIDESGILDGYNIRKGLSLYTYDNSDLMIFHPQQLLTCNIKNINDEIIFVWLDNNLGDRIHRYAEEGRSYDFNDIEQAESSIDAEFVKALYGFPQSSVLYFHNELPERIAAIIVALIKHPDLIELFLSNYH